MESWRVKTLQLESFSYAYPGSQHAALDRVDLDLDGGLVALAGDSGSGKSTLLRVCNGLVPHFHGGTVRGSARVLGMDVLHLQTRRLARDVALLFQDSEAQSVYATVERDVAFGLENLGVPRNEMHLRVQDALAHTSITALRGRAVSTLSGGERQRLALAGLLAMQPRLLVLDEPLAQLDQGGAASLMKTLASVNRRGTAVLLAEHRLEHVLPVATGLITISEGRLANGADHRSRETLDHEPRATSKRLQDAPAEWELRRVSAGFGGTPVVHDVNLAGGPEVVALSGPNGSGKTTLLRTLAGLLPPLAGTVRRPAGRVAYLPQNPTALLHRPTVRAELEWTLRRDTPARRARAVDAMLDLFALCDVAGRYPRDLSGGQRQRAALAAVLVGAPALALLDEPTRGMDAPARRSLIAAIRGLRDAGSAVLLATHDRELAQAVADRVITIDRGVAREQPAMVRA
ncbi:MAG: ATP-binding cassette domain-containing protein [Candidatus Dormibacteraeota bacterium]|nr:ATP-binding cassette domain-containing protein [Candidatus Dormibacteraeota bacterium]